METMEKSFEAMYDEGLKLYTDGAPLEEVLAFFNDLSKKSNDMRVMISLSWLHILLGNKDQAFLYLKEAKKTVQGKFNYVLALLAFGGTGVRERFEQAVEAGGAEGVNDAIENLEDAIARKEGSFKPAEKMLSWLKEIKK
ncbi:MAG TPA: hypothetical protein V6C82_01845 [Chroococcales cyanobacterium]|jgi:hypothetical protein